MGKTQLAVAFARKHHEKFSAIFWLDGSSIDRLKESFADLASRLPSNEISTNLRKSLEVVPLDVDAVMRGILQWLSLPSNKHWLVIIDSVDRDWKAKDQDVLAYNPRECLPQADHESILATSRLAGMADAFEAEMHVDRLNDAQAKSVPGKNAGRKLEGTLRGGIARTRPY